ncbi:ATP/GTP-binding protein [Streptomyces sp. NWU49]|uniref:ATP/GTP-binding protein n=1 Tax=Streptomyces sp. NWU49 TaxID=2201153 RepID=UPI00215AF758|nr:ATP/GTP-binding protein [Streptomyces sp. NWU49]
MSDDTEGQLINFPVGTDITDRPPQLPDPGRLFPDASEGSAIPPESPEETTLELPAVPAAPRPEATLVSSREIPLADPGGISTEEIEESEYVQPRSLADRLGDWLEYRLEVARERRAEEAPFREAEVARKAALLESRTAQETAMMEQNAKFHAAQMKAKADKAAARGKTDAARSSGSGMGADKGGRSKAGGGGGSRGGGGSSSGTGGGRGSRTNGSGGTGRGSGGGNSPKGAGKGSDRSAGGRGGASKGNESSGGPKSRQNGSEGSGGGKSGTGKGSSGGSGKSGSGSSGSGKGGSKGNGGKTQHSPASSPGAERARGRQERAAARQAARQQRRSADQAADLADRSKNRDQDRANRQAEREERRKAKAERKAARKAKREAAKAADDRTTFGEAMTEEAQRRWDKRHADAKDTKDGEDGAEKVSPTKDKEAEGKGTDSKGGEDAKGASEGPSSAAEDGKASDGEAGKDAKAGDGPSDSSEKKRRRFRRRTAGTGRAGRRDHSRRTRRTERSDRPSDSPFGAQDSTPTVEWPEHDTRPPKPAAKAEDDIVDADMVPDGPAAVTTGVKGLPPAPEPHTQRPGTTRPTAQEDPVASEVSRPTSGQTGMAAQHRTDITFGEYLMEIVNIAIAAALDKDRAQDLAVALGKVADALRDMATDLIGDHNISTTVTDQITDLADAADRMKQLAERCATECEIASEAARIAAMSVGRVYGEDIQAMDDAGLAHASAAAHHD